MSILYNLVILVLGTMSMETVTLNWDKFCAWKMLIALFFIGSWEEGGENQLKDPIMENQFSWLQCIYTMDYSRAFIMIFGE